MTWTLHTADVVDWLRDYDGPRFHATFGDPPYALAFMNKAFDTFKSPRHYQDWVTEWGALLIERALYPGAVCAFFGGTRTWARLGVGLEDAGFEPFDTIALLWVQGQGFPKGYALGKNGAGEAWQGHNVNLKPAFEPILLMRAPRNGATYVDLALEYGTGGLNVDGCRVTIRGNDSDFRTAPATAHVPFETPPGGYRPNGKHYTVNNPNPQSARHNAAGRYPPNLLLQHAPGCRRVGERRVRGISRSYTRNVGVNGGVLDWNAESEGERVDGYTDPDGMETVAAWECVEGCPVKALGEQSGELNSHGGGNRYAGGWFTPDHPEGYVIPKGDAGTAARFFPQLEADAPEPFLYCAKASTSERSAGLEERCTHPTVKPLKVCEWVARLLLPPPLDEPRRILIPFAGVASEMIGACRAGFEEVIGVEMDAEYCAVGELRLAHWLAEPVQQELL